MRRFFFTICLSAVAFASTAELTDYLRAHHNIAKPEMVDLGKIAFQDGHIDDEEMRVLKDLSLGPGEVTLSDHPDIYVHVSTEAAQLAQLLTGRKSIAEMSHNGALQDLVDVYIIESTDEARRNIADGIAQNLEQLWKNSNPQNGYAPIREQLSSWAAQLGEMVSPDQKAAAADMLYQACQKLDFIPPSMYEFLKNMRSPRP